jgi:hypothetical protein
MFLFSHITVMAAPRVSYVLLGGWGLGIFLGYILSLFVLNRVCPWKKLVITAEFNGLPERSPGEHVRPKTTSRTFTSSSTSSTVGKAYSFQIQGHPY